MKKYLRYTYHNFDIEIQISKLLPVPHTAKASCIKTRMVVDVYTGEEIHAIKFLGRLLVSKEHYKELIEKIETKKLLES